MNEDSAVPAGPVPEPAGDRPDSGDDDHPWAEYQLERDEHQPEEAGYGYGV